MTVMQAIAKPKTAHLGTAIRYIVLPTTVNVAARSAGASTVVSTRRSEAHRVRPHSVTSVCGVYSCSSLLDPAPNAKFGPIGDAVMCTACFGRT
jgi:hypothetical protein